MFDSFNSVKVVTFQEMGRFWFGYTNVEQQNRHCAILIRSTPKLRRENGPPETKARTESPRGLKTAGAPRRGLDRWGQGAEVEIGKVGGGGEGGPAGHLAPTPFLLPPRK